MIFRKFWYLSRSASLLAVMGFVLLVAIGIGSLVSAVQLLTLIDSVSQSRLASEKLTTLLLDLNEEETSLRGFLLTGDERFVQKKADGPERFAQELAALRALTADDPAILRDSAHLETLHAKRLAWSASAIALYAEQGPAAAVRYLAAGTGLDINNAARAALASLRDRQAATQVLREARATRATRVASVAIPVGISLAVLVFLAALGWMNGEVSRRQRLQQERDRFFDNSLDMLTITGFDGHIESINPAWTRTLGWTAEEITTQAWLSFVHPEDHALTIAASTAMMQGKEAREFENRCRCKDGSYRWLSWSGRAYQDSRQLYTVVRDVTESRRALEKMRLLETCIDRLNDIVLITEAEPQSKPGPRIVYVNDAFEMRTGYTREEVIGQTPRLLQGPKTQQAALARISNALRQWQPCREELINYTKTGEEFWIELDIVPVANASGWFTHWIAIERDITERKATENRLQLAASVFTHSRDGITITDTNGTILDVNSAFERITGYRRHEVLGQNPRILQSGLQGAEFYASMWQTLTDKGYWTGELFNRRKSGEVFPEIVTISAVQDANDQLTNYLAIFSDMSELHAHQQLLERIANHDPLTGLPNRSGLEQFVEESILAAQRSGDPVAMMMLSIDNFKSLNSALGHQSGDQLLVAFQQRVKAGIRELDMLGRLPGEGFVIVLPATALSGATTLALKLAEVLALPFTIKSHEILLTASIGIASYPADASDFEGLVSCCSSAMFRSKQAGGNGYQLFNEAMHRQGLENQVLANALRTAIGSDQLTLHYQPLVDLQSGAIGGMEALLRWQHPTLGAVSPTRFIPVAEQCGLIKPIGAWVLRQACQDIRHWLNRGLAVPQVAINVSPIQFRDVGLAREIERTLAEFGIDPGLIYVEVTEGALMEDVVRSEATMRSLKSLGVKLSLDDFGTGYSSLSYLKLFPFDKVKIDQSFVRNMLTKNEDAIIATVVVSMAHGLGLRVIAEGVETEAQCAFLRDNMCDEIQGYLFSRPVPAVAMQALLEQAQCLPLHLLRARVRARALLIVDDEPNVISSLKRLLRRDGYTIHSASSGQAGLDVLANHPVDIILSDQRMPGMTGVEFLRSAKEHYPSTLRIVLSGYTELQSVTDAINEGAVYRFLTKPWIDDQLRSFILEAFQHKEMADENQQLNLKIRTANSELAKSNRQLLESNNDKQQLIVRSELSLNVVRETLHRIPLPVLGVDDTGMVAFVNTAAMKILNSDAFLLGSDLVSALPELSEVVNSTAEGARGVLKFNSLQYRVEWHTMGDDSASRGKIISLVEDAILV